MRSYSACPTKKWSQKKVWKKKIDLSCSTLVTALTSTDYFTATAMLQIHFPRHHLTHFSLPYWTYFQNTLWACFKYSFFIIFNFGAFLRQASTIIEKLSYWKSCGGIGPVCGHTHRPPFFLRFSQSPLLSTFSNSVPHSALVKQASTRSHKEPEKKAAAKHLAVEPKTSHRSQAHLLAGAVKRRRYSLNIYKQNAINITLIFYFKNTCRD